MAQPPIFTIANIDCLNNKVSVYRIGKAVRNADKIDAMTYLNDPLFQYMSFIVRKLVFKRKGNEISPELKQQFNYVINDEEYYLIKVVDDDQVLNIFRFPENPNLVPVGPGPGPIPNPLPVEPGLIPNPLPDGPGPVPGPGSGGPGGPGGLIQGGGYYHKYQKYVEKYKLK